MKKKKIDYKQQIKQLEGRIESLQHSNDDHYRERNKIKAILGIAGQITKLEEENRRLWHMIRVYSNDSTLSREYEEILGGRYRVF